MKKGIIKTTALVLMLVGIGFGVYFLLKLFGLNDIETLRKIVNKGFLGALIYILLQIIQVIFIPINTSIFTIPAIVLFGPVKAFFVSWIGCTLGSIIMFLIAKIWGIKVLKWIVGEDKAIKYANFLRKGKYLLPIFLTIPIFPDDIMCASAGLGNINFWYFCVVIVITRAIDTFCTCFIGSALVKTPLGIVALVLIAIAMCVIGFFVTKNQDKIDNWFVSKFTKKDNGKDN